MGKQKSAEYFEEVETNRKYDGYFYSIPEAISIAVLGNQPVHFHDIKKRGESSSIMSEKSE